MRRRRWRRRAAGWALALLVAGAVGWVGLERLRPPLLIRVTAQEQHEAVQAVAQAEAPRREHRQTHDLDQTDIFFLDVMQLRVRMVNTKRILIRRDVIAEHQIQLIEIAILSGNRRDRVVRFSVRLGINKGILIRIAAPCTQHFFAKINQAVRILGTSPQN